MPNPKKRGGNRARRRGNGNGEMLGTSVELGAGGKAEQLGAAVDTMNAREKQIIEEVGSHQTKITKLLAEQTGIRVKRVQTLREIDAAAQG